MSQERLADLVARRNLGPGISHNEVADLIDDLRDERAAHRLTLARLEKAREALRTIGYEPIGAPDASVVTIYGDIVKIARAALEGETTP